MPTVRKSMRDLNFVIGGILVSQGGGENDFITVTSPQRYGSKTGVHNDVVFFDTPNSVYEITITTLETSSVNEDLQNIFAAQNASQTQGPWTTQIEDIGTGEELSGKAMIVKEPDKTKTAEVQNYEWTLHLASKDGWKYNARSLIITIP